MSNSQLPERASLEYLKKLAKDRLRELRLTDRQAKLAAAQLSIAREHGFSSWRALKDEVERRQSGNTVLFFEACARGDVAALRDLLANEPGLVRVADAAASHGGWMGLHTASQHGHLDAVRFLLQHGADPNAREAGDNTYPLHWAAASRHIEVVRALLDAGGDVHGVGDDHELDAIGWATYFHEPGRAPGDRPEVASLLVERGARHHIFSAMSLGDLGPIRTLVEQNPKALDRRMSRFEQGLTPLHFAISRNRYDILDLLIELGADLEAKDKNGHTAIETAMLRGDQEAARRLREAGAREPARIRSSNIRSKMSKLADSTRKCVPMIYVPDVAAALDWYTSIGFKEIARYADDGLVNFGMVSYGKAEIMLNMHGKRGEHDVSLWLYTDKVDELYRLLKSRQIEAAITGATGGHEGIDFVEHINDTFYRARQFGIRDLNGYILYFIQDLER
jgi:ankyrin repeat protein/glyoxalase/bleomycin resistance protein/dioxygenase superfamily protein